MSDSVSAPTGTPPVPSAPKSRFVRTVIIAALALSLSFLGLLNVVTSVPLIRDSLGPLVSEHHVVSGMAIFVTLAVALLVPIVALILCSRRGWLHWPQLTVLSAFVLATFAYLMWDDPIVRRPLTMDELAPSLPGDEATFHVFLRYAKNSPASIAFKDPESRIAIAQATTDIVGKPEKWAQFLRDNRAGVESAWAELDPVRGWWDEMATHPRIGDLTVPRPDAPIIAFQPVRTYTQVAVAVASLQALDGHGDEAMATITRLYDVARKFEPNARTLVRAMIAKVIQKMALQAGGFVLDHAAVSPASRAAFAGEISAAAGGPAGARRLILIEYAVFQPMFSSYSYFTGAPITGSRGEQFMQQCVHFLGRVVVNPRATQNLIGDRYYQLAALAEERRLGELEASKGPINREFLGGYHVKNIGGRLFADMTMPALSKVMKAYWDIEDIRAALLTRLKA
jgi:hypothetical protein